MMKLYEDIPVFREGLNYSEPPIGIASVVVDEASKRAVITVTTTTEEFNNFIEQGTLKAIGLDAQVNDLIPRE